MSTTDEDEYGDIADEDLIEFEALSQPSQTLPLLPRAEKRPRDDDDISKDEQRKRRRKSRASTSEDGGSEEEEQSAKKRKPKYKIITSVQPAPPAKIIGATQAEQLPDSSPYRIRGPIYMKPRPEPKPPSPPPQRPVSFQPRPQQSRVMSLPAQRPAPLGIIQQARRQSPRRPDVEEDDFGLEDLPSDAFSTPEKPAGRASIFIESSPLQPTQAGQLPRQYLMAPQQGLRQMNLFGRRAPEEPPPTQSQTRGSQPKSKKVYNFIKDLPPEEPTHHALNEDALQTWIYPTNLGAIRDYQYNIVHNGLFNNLLVALPTGLGKTFIAATIMLNFFRWTKKAQIVFVAPTKPLVAQQVGACFNIVGIPKSQTTMLTGDQNTNLRAEEWEDKRVFFMTPQTLHNDLSTGIADPKKICLLVVDEAHRATGNYSYVKVVTFLRRFNKSFRILALTATPGASVEAVQEVIDNLEISKVEIRTEESLDIQQYVHRRDIDQILIDPSDEIIMIKELFAKALQPLVNTLCGQSAYYNKDPMALTPFGLMQARNQWQKSDAGRKAPPGLKGMVIGLFTILASVAHSIKLLNFHGISAFYSAIKDFRQGVENAKVPGKYRSQIVDHQDFKKMMNMIQAWISKDDFIGHPKLTYLCDTILNHFLDAGEGRLGQDAPPSSTRVIVFAEFRDSAEDIVRVLNRHGPMIRATVFVGQADSKRSEGMNQAKQQETISQFKSGKFNVIVATSIGEEGLDIGQVDLIVCYDASGSPIRMLQRMGRTGRKRAGHIVLLLMRGKEEESFAKAKDNYEQMQKMISSGERFAFRHDLSVRILPRGIKPLVDKKMIEIPVENTQDPSLPEPRRRATKAKKKREKVFHMPDGVQTGFTKASKLGADAGTLTRFGVTVKKKKVDTPVEPIPSVGSALLTSNEERELARKYQDIAGDDVQEVELPNMTAQTVAQRSLRPHGNVAHGEYTVRCVKLFKTLSKMQRKEDQFHMPYGDVEPSLDYLKPPVVDDGRPPKSRPRKAPAEPKTKKPAAPKKARIPKVAKAKALKKQSRAAQFLAAVDLESGEDEISGPASSEGEGDDLMHSEEVSDDEDDGGSSLRDFIATSSQHTASQGVARSSTSPPAMTGPESEDEEVTPVARGKRVVSELFAIDSDEEEAEDEIPDFITSKGLVEAVQSFDSDDIVAPIPSRGRKEKRRVVEDSDDE